ncbi:MAG TPA: adenylosuccinate synthase [Thermoanaerobaculia bacterium]|jgi:adenylosuccinate synthase|nr:adenylosuccinate synthase [Thermoanaerobaculia bacterium]
MTNIVVVGMQWGDEGKGKIVDLLCPAFDVVARYQGGHNAGHTVRFGEQHFSLRLIPSGILHPEVQCVLGNGMVVAPDAFFEEVDKLRQAGVVIDGRLFVSERAQVILAEHAALDLQREAAAGSGKIGTTGRGIGPAYEHKVGRAGIRVCDLGAPDLEERLRPLLLRLDAELRALGDEQAGHPVRVADQCRAWAERLAPFRRDTAALLHEAIRAGKRVMFEGAQGSMLDVDHGTYPFVTSSSATTGGACTGTGVPPRAIGGVLGVLKAYTTRVGGGPLPTEDLGAAGEYLRKRGNEFGTVTGRPRRCGWMDLVAARQATALNGVDAIALTKLDVLDGFAEIPVCTGYRYKGSALRGFPAELRVLEEVIPEYRVMPGWRKQTVGILDYEKLPQQARDYVAYLEGEIEAPIALVSTGPRREETILRQGPGLKRIAGDRLTVPPRQA